MTLSFRPFTAEELPDALALLGFAFAESYEDDDLAAERTVQPPDRSQAAFDGDTMVGCLGSYAHRLSVPGGEVACAGTTWVSVLPTHRRRGILRQMMQAHLADAMSADEPIAALWASETAIYARYGYGVAMDMAAFDLRIDPEPEWLDSAPPAPDRVRLVTLEDAPAVLQPIFDAARRRRGGIPARSPEWWRFQVLSTRKSAMQGAAFKAVAVAERDGQDVAYAIYGNTDKWADNRAAGTVNLIEMLGVDANAESSMWRYLASHDLMARLKAFRRPIDDTLPLLLEDSRLAQQGALDGLHVRILDLPTALTARSYSASAGLTIEVQDSMVDINDGGWRVEVAPEGAVVQPSTDPPDLECDIRVMGSAYLGGMSLHRLAGAGMIRVHNPDALAAFDMALRPPEAPMAPEVW